MESNSEQPAPSRRLPKQSSSGDDNGDTAGKDNNGDVNAEIQQKIGAQLRDIIQEDEGVVILTEYIWHMAKDPNISLQFMNDELIEFLDDKAAAFSKWLASDVLPLLRPSAHESSDCATCLNSTSIASAQNSSKDQIEYNVHATKDVGDVSGMSSPVAQKMNADMASRRKERRSRILGLAVKQVAEEQHIENSRAGDSKGLSQQGSGSGNYSMHQSGSRGGDGPSRRATTLRPKQTRGSPHRTEVQETRGREESHSRRSRQPLSLDDDAMDGSETRRSVGSRHDRYLERERTRDDSGRAIRSGGSDTRHFVGSQRGHNYGDEPPRRVREIRHVSHTSRSRSRENGMKPEYYNRRRDPRWRELDHEEGEAHLVHSGMEAMDNTSHEENVGSGDDRRFRKDPTDERGAQYEYTDSPQSGTCRAVLRPNPYFESFGMEEQQSGPAVDNRYDNVNAESLSLGPPYYKQPFLNESQQQGLHLPFAPDQHHFAYSSQQSNSVELSGKVVPHDIPQQWQQQPQSGTQQQPLQPMLIGGQQQQQTQLSAQQQNVWNASSAPQPWPQPRPPPFYSHVQQPQHLQSTPQASATPAPFPFPTGSPENYMGTALGPQREPQIKKRCMNYPKCIFGDNCRYVHPTEMCQTWPRCPYGIECFFIHPEVPCKYGIHCLNWYCNYKHPANWSPPMANDMFGCFGGVSSPFFPGGGGQAKFRNKTLHLALQSTNSEELVVEANDEEPEAVVPQAQNDSSSDAKIV